MLVSVLDLLYRLNQQLLLLFMEFQKVFDSVNREPIWIVPARRRGILEIDLGSIIKMTYDGAKGHELHRGKTAAEFEVKSGNCQDRFCRRYIRQIRTGHQRCQRIRISRKRCVCWRIDGTCCHSTH